MSEINLKVFEFETYVLDNVKLFDEVLRDVGEPPLFENQNFTIHSAFEPLSHYLVMETTNKITNTLPVTIWFEGEDLVIDVDGMRESLEWAKKHIDKDRNSVVTYIRNLFTGYVLVESRGNSHFVQIFDSDGSFAHSFSYNNLFHMITGLYLFRYKNYRRLYLPIFSKTK